MDPARKIPPEPLAFWRVTDERSRIRIDPHGNFDTGSHNYMSWSWIITPKNLNYQLDWSHKFRNHDSNDHANFVSVTDNYQWALKEVARRLRLRCQNVQLHQINLSGFRWETLPIGRQVLEYLHHADAGAVFFSTRAASAATGWINPLMSEREWFALEFIPRDVIERIPLRTTADAC